MGRHGTFVTLYSMHKRTVGLRSRRALFMVNAAPMEYAVVWTGRPGKV